MKLDLFAWHEVKPSVEFASKPGRVWLKASAPVAVYITAQGYEVLAGTGIEVDVSISETVTVRVEPTIKGTVRVFWYAPHFPAHRGEGEVFTNPDRMVHESGSVAEVRRAMREMQLQQQAMLRDMRIERAKLRRAKQAAEPEPPQPEPSVDGDPVEVSDADSAE